MKDRDPWETGTNEMSLAIYPAYWWRNHGTGRRNPGISCHAPWVEEMELRVQWDQSRLEVRTEYWRGEIYTEWDSGFLHRFSLEYWVEYQPVYAYEENYPRLIEELHEDQRIHTYSSWCSQATGNSACSHQPDPKTLMGYWVSRVLPQLILY